MCLCNNSESSLHHPKVLKDYVRTENTVPKVDTQVIISFYLVLSLSLLFQAFVVVIRCEILTFVITKMRAASCHSPTVLFAMLYRVIKRSLFYNMHVLIVTFLAGLFTKFFVIFSQF